MADLQQGERSRACSVGHGRAGDVTNGVDEVTHAIDIAPAYKHFHARSDHLHWKRHEPCRYRLPRAGTSGVANACNGTSKLRDGMRVRVDGTAGRLEILDDVKGQGLR